MDLLRLPLAAVRLPIGLGLGAARLAFEAAAGVARSAYEAVAPTGDGPRRPIDVPPPAAPPARPADTPPPATPPVPDHVSEEPELVVEAAERGAEEGAGAEVNVEEPWPGYDGMRAADIRDRLVSGGGEVAAAVSLYEAAHKGRSSVLEAATRATRRA
jgi:hypothetical protein